MVRVCVVGREYVLGIKITTDLLQQALSFANKEDFCVASAAEVQKTKIALLKTFRKMSQFLASACFSSELQVVLVLESSNFSKIFTFTTKETFH